MTGQFYEPQARDLIACDDGVHYVLLDRASDFCNWVMRRHPDGPLVSVRKATDHELAHAKARQHLRAGVAMLQGDAPEQRTPAPACQPEDQDELYRIHRAFIALDEPNNEQVMAFQDASYALGLKRGQAREAALQQRLNEADQRIDELRGQVSKLNEEAEFCDKVGQGIEDVLRSKLGEAEQLLREFVDWYQATEDDSRGLLRLIRRADAICQLTKDSPEVGS